MKTKVLVVGAGPIGIEMAVALKRSGIEYRQVEAGCLAATIAWYAPGTAFFSSPERLSLAGVPFETSPHYKATREEYLHYLRSVVKQFELQIQTYTKLVQVKKIATGFSCQLQASTHGVGGPEESGEVSILGKSPDALTELEAEKLIFAVGDMHAPRMLGIPGEDLSHVSHYLKDPHYYSGRQVLIVGGANSAAEAALRLYRVGAKITLIYRQPDFAADRIKPWLLPELRALIREKKVTFYPSAEARSIESGAVTIAVNNREERVEADSVLLLTGYAQRTPLFEQLGIRLQGDARAPEHDEATMETNCKGAYVIGTAVAGSQARAKHFIETSHIHINRVLESLGVTGYPDYSAKLRPVEEREL